MAVLGPFAQDDSVRPPHLLAMQNHDAFNGYGNRWGNQKFGQSNNTGFSHGAFHSNAQPQQGFGDRNVRKNNMPFINTASKEYQNGTSEPTPGTAYNMNFTPLLPSELLLGSPFQPGSPGAFGSPQFSNVGRFPQATNALHQQTQQYQHNQQAQMGSPTQSVVNPMSPQMYQPMSPDAFVPQSPTAFSGLGGLHMVSINR